MKWVLFWDIDGTLLTTLRAGAVALEDAYRSVTERPLEMSGFETAGLPDTEIATRILARAGQPIDPASVCPNPMAVTLPGLFRRCRLTR